MKNKFIPQKYEYCARFSKEELAEICLGLLTAKDKHYISFAKNRRLQKKYVDRAFRRAEAYFLFIKAEAQKRGNWDFLFDNNVAVIFKKNSFIGFKIVGEKESSL